MTLSAQLAESHQNAARCVLKRHHATRIEKFHTRLK